MKLLLYIVGCMIVCWPSLLRADEPESIFLFPELPDKSESIHAFIPEGWNLLDSCSGLLDNDERTDLALIIQMEDTSLLNNMINEDTLLEEYRPRILLILSQNSDNLLVKSCQSNQAILSENEGGTPGDPFRKIEISNHELTFSFWGGSTIQWGLEYHFHYQVDGYYLFQALSNGSGPGETYSYDYNFQNGELHIEVQDEKDPGENLKYSKVRKSTDQPRLENFLPLSYVVDAYEGIIF